jgi:chromate transporter
MLLSAIGRRRLSSGKTGANLPALFLTTGSPSLPLVLTAATTPPSLLTLFLTFLKIGAILYGSGYVLLAFIQNDFVHGLGWLSSKQVLDAVAIGQITPGPVFTTATFVGYLVLGVPGALLATLAIFLPAFVYTPLVFPLIPRLRQSPVFSAFLDGVNASALGLMAGVSWTLGRAAVVDPFTAVLAVFSVVGLTRFKLNAAWLIAAGGIVSIAYKLASG